jgi:hypothetical protein
MLHKVIRQKTSAGGGRTSHLTWLSMEYSVSVPAQAPGT